MWGLSPAPWFGSCSERGSVRTWGLGGALLSLGWKAGLITEPRPLIFPVQRLGLWEQEVLCAEPLGLRPSEGGHLPLPVLHAGRPVGDGGDERPQPRLPVLRAFPRPVDGGYLSLIRGVTLVPGGQLFVPGQMMALEGGVGREGGCWGWMRPLCCGLSIPGVIHGDSKFLM